MKHLLLALTLFASSAFAGERQVINPDANGDLKMIVNMGGTATTVLQVTGSSGVMSIGPTTLFTSGINAINGRTQVKGGQTNAEALSVKSNIATTGQSYGLVVDAGTNASDQNTLWRDQAGTTTFGSILGNGAWTVGPTTSNQTLTINGTDTILNSNASTVRVGFSMRKNNTVTAGIYVEGTASDFLTGAAAGDLSITSVNKNIDFSTNGTSVGASLNGSLFTSGTTTNGGLNMNNFAGMWAESTGSSSTSCEATCAGNESNHGQNTSSGHCIMAWNSATGNLLGTGTFGCTDVTAATARRCICAGFN